MKMGVGDRMGDLANDLIYHCGTEPTIDELSRLRIAAFVAYGALKAISPKDSEVVKCIEEMLWPKPLFVKRGDLTP